MKQIESFIKRLKTVEHCSTVYNPYRDKDAVNNLRAYLYLIKQEITDVKMLIGEAPGYLGCRITGIPFTSSEQLSQTQHPLLKHIIPQLKFSSLQSENTANYMWQVLGNKKNIPLLWNSFPFHPHHKNKPTTNRAPNAKEIAIGKDFLLELNDIFTPTKVASIGRKGEKALQLAFPDQEITYIRHPSYGGKSDFVTGMTRFLS